MKSSREKLRNALEFTKIYHKYSDDKYIREAKCLEFQLEHILMPMDAQDGIAGRYEHDFVGFSTQVGGYSSMTGGPYTYYFNEYGFINALQECSSELTTEERFDLAHVQAFWHEEQTSRKLDLACAKAIGYVPYKSYHAPGFGDCDCRVAGTNVDYEKLIQLGFDGLNREIEAAIEKNGDHSFYQALKLWIHSLQEACRRYQKQAEQMAEQAMEAEVKIRFQKLASALENIRHNPPQSFLEGVQLMWIYSVSSDLMNYSRMDDYLGHLYTQDVDQGVITEEEAVQILLYLYKHFSEINKIHDCRVIIGGVGRKRPEMADRLAIIIMEASRRYKKAVPQLTMRYYTGMDEAVFQKAMEVNAEGTTFPIIYSDDTNVPAVQAGYGVTREEAEQYVPFGCGEYVLVGYSVGTPNCGINVLKALEIVLHNGVDAFRHVDCGLHTGEPASFDTFEKLYEALMQQIQPVVEAFAVRNYLNYKVAGENAPYLHLSLLMDDCIARGLPVFEGGVRYLNASSEWFGLISCADSLTAIKTLVYEQHRFTLEELVHILDCDFEGYEKERKLCLEAPKYGNDDENADAMATKLFSDIAGMNLDAGRRLTKLNHYGIVSVNNSMSAEWGYCCEASACGRKRSSAMANANGASIGADRCGITSLLHSMAKFDHTKHVGVINNIRFSKEMFRENMEKVGTLLKVFYKNGGVQTNLCVVGRDDLEQAMRYPEKYQDLMVRIGGFSARFVTLSPVVQQELIERTTY